MTKLIHLDIAALLYPCDNSDLAVYTAHVQRHN